MTAQQLKYSTGFNLPFNADDALKEFSFVNLKNGNTQVTLSRSDPSSPGAQSIKAGNVQLFTSGSQSNGGTISYRGSGTQFFSTPTADASVAVDTQGGAGKIKVSTGSKPASVSTTTWLIVGGVVIAAGVGLYLLLRR